MHQTYVLSRVRVRVERSLSSPLLRNWQGTHTSPTAVDQLIDEGER